MRTTIDLPDHLHRTARAIALDTSRSLSETVAALVRRGLRNPITSPIACPITEGALVRFLLREGVGGRTARTVLEGLSADPRHAFWPDEVPVAEVPLAEVPVAEVPLDRLLAHRQVTDAYLAQLAQRSLGRLATFDQGLAALHGDVAELIPPRPPPSWQLAARSVSVPVVRSSSMPPGAPTMQLARFPLTGWFWQAVVTSGVRSEHHQAAARR